MANAVLTDLGVEKLTTASGTGSKVEITHLALGDGNGGTYTAVSGQNALRREKIRVPISRRYQISNTQWLTTTIFPPETPANDVWEAAWIDADGDIIGIVTFPANEMRRTGGVEFKLAHVLDFAAAGPNLTIVDAPDDELYDFQAVTIAMFAQTAMRQFQSWEAHNATHGVYPGEPL